MAKKLSTRQEMLKIGEYPDNVIPLRQGDQELKILQQRTANILSAAFQEVVQLLGPAQIDPFYKQEIVTRAVDTYEEWARKQFFPNMDQ